MSTTRGDDFDIVGELYRVFDSRWATARTRRAAYRGAEEVEVLRKRLRWLGDDEWLGS